MLKAERASGFGVKMHAVEDNEELEEIDIMMEALRRAWRRWMASPTSYNWHRQEETWTKAVETAEKGGEGAVKKILQPKTTRYHWVAAPDHDEGEGGSGTDSGSDSSSATGREPSPLTEQ